MSDSTYANERMDALGKNRDSSGVYFDKDGKAIVDSGTTLSFPTAPVTKAIDSAFKVLRAYKSYRLIDGDTVGILSTEFPGFFFYVMTGTNEFGKEQTQTFKIEFEDSDDVKKYTRRVSQGIFSKDKFINEWRLAVSTISGIINSQNSEFLKNLFDQKAATEAALVQKKADIASNQADDVAKVGELLGLSPEDATAYLAAGHTVKEASEKVTAWNLADPSQRRFMIAQDGLTLENRNKASEYKTGAPKANLANTGKEIDDVFKGVRKPFVDKKATKSYIALVKENLNSGEAISASKGLGPTTLLKIQEFYMQSVNEIDSEKYQIVETFNKPKIYFFDRRARIYNYSFIVENTGVQKGTQEESNQYGNQWRDLFKNTYELYLRGTKSVENRVKAVIHYDEITRIGYVLSCSMSMDSSNDNLASVNITMFVEDEQQRNAYPSINTSVLNDVVKEATVAAAKQKLTKTIIYGDKNGKDPQQTIVCDNILNPQKPGRSTFPPDGSYVSIFLTEIPKTDDFKNPGEPISGDVVLNSKNVTLILGNNPNANPLVDSEGIFLCTTSPTNSAIKDGIPFTIPNSGVKAFVVVDTTSKSIQDLYAKNPGTDLKLSYSFGLDAVDNPDSRLRIQGSILLKSAILDIKVVIPNKVNAVDQISSGQTVVKMDTSNFTSSLGVDGLTKVYKGSFEFNIVDKVNQVGVALPSFTDIKEALKVDTIKGSLDPSTDKSAFKETFILITPKNSNTATCDITITAVMNSGTVLFSGESCILKSMAKIGVAALNVEINFIREKDNTDYNLIGAWSLSSDKVPFDLNISYTDRPSLPNVITLFFDADPGPGIGKLIQFTGGMEITNNSGKGTAKLNVIGNKKSSYLGISGSESEFNNPNTISNVTLLYQGITKKSIANVMSEFNGVTLAATTATDIFCVQLGCNFTINGAFLDLISSFLVSSGNEANSNGTVIKRVARIQKITSDGKISIAKTKHSSSIRAVWNNTNKEYFGIAG